MIQASTPINTPQFVEKENYMPNYGMGFKSFIDQVDDEYQSKTRRKMNKRSHKGRHYGVDPRDSTGGISNPAVGAGSSNAGNTGAVSGGGGLGESGALPFTFGADVKASASYGQGMGFDPDSYPKREQEENANKEDDFEMEDKEEDQDDFNLDEEGDDFDLEGGEGEGDEDEDRQGVIRTVDNSHLIFKRQNEEGTYDELWIYNTGADMKDELEIRRNILAGTDIPSNRTKSDDGTQAYTLTSMGNAQYLQIRGLPN